MRCELDGKFVFLCVCAIFKEVEVMVCADENIPPVEKELEMFMIYFNRLNEQYPGSARP